MDGQGIAPHRTFVERCTGGPASLTVYPSERSWDNGSAGADIFIAHARLSRMRISSPVTGNFD